MKYPNKRAVIQEILEKNGYFDWYVAQPDKQNPDSSNAKCVLVNFVEQRRAELVIPNEWFQRYHRIAKLIRLAVQHSTRVGVESGRLSDSSRPSPLSQKGREKNPDLFTRSRFVPRRAGWLHDISNY